MGTRFILSALVVVSMEGATANAAYIEFQPVQTYVIPGAHDIQYVRFNDLDLDQSPEILTVEADRLTLYHPTLDSALYTLAIDPNETRRVIFDDVNRDGVPDLVEGGVYSPDYRYARVTMVDGLSIWLETPQIQMRGFLIYEVAVWSSAMLGFLQAVDINLDGMKELAFSYDSAYEDHWSYYEFGGHTRCYYSFPDSLLWTRPEMFLGFWPLGSDDWLTTVYSGYYQDLMGGSFGFSADLSIYDASALDQYVAEIESQSKDGYTKYMIPICVGNMITVLAGNEVLVATIGQLYSGPPDFEHAEIGELQMFQYVAPDSLGSVWQMDMFPLPLNILAHGGFSGHYLGFIGDTLKLFRGIDGSVAYFTTDVPAGRRQWCYPYNDGLPYLAVMNGDTVAIYSLAVSTAVDDGGEGPSAIPNMLAVGAPHPNPFNLSQIIPISAKPGKQLIVDVYNLLGQKVATIFDGRVSAAQVAVPWKAEGLASGIYLIRATSGDESVTVKSILLK